MNCDFQLLDHGRRLGNVWAEAEQHRLSARHEELGRYRELQPVAHLKAALEARGT
jgi:hypothetical protein